jgi:hypothetical protein
LDASPFRDERLRSDDRLPDCFLCGLPVEPLLPTSGTYGHAKPMAPLLDLHLQCLNGRDMLRVHQLYMGAIAEIARSASN